MYTGETAAPEIPNKNAPKKNHNADFVALQTRHETLLIDHQLEKLSSSVEKILIVVLFYWWRFAKYLSNDTMQTGCIRQSVSVKCNTCEIFDSHNIWPNGLLVNYGSK